MNNYEKHAYLYASWVAVIIPCLCSAYIVQKYFFAEFNEINVFINLISKFVSVSILVVIYGSVGFLVRNFFRATSKIIFQFPLFREDETKMPTTEMLLYRDHQISEEEKNVFRDKVEKLFNFKMKSAQTEEQNESEARLNIVSAVGFVKNYTRKDKIVEQANYRYGFQRNQLGGLVWSFLLCLICFIISICVKNELIAVFGIATLLIIIQAVLAWILMKYAARNYARTLIHSFISFK